MRVAPIGAFFPRSPDALNAFTKVCTCVTHTDPKALIGAKAITLTAAWIVREAMCEKPPIEAFCKLLRDIAPEDGEWSGLVSKMDDGLTKNASVGVFAASLSLKREITGYIYHTVPIVLYAWHRHFGDYRATIGSVIDCGGDTDTTGAISGALSGLTVGESGIPSDWVDGIKDWPRTTALLRSAADRLSNLVVTGESPGPVRYFWPGVVVRNLIFLGIVLFHGFRRLLPPY